METIPKSNKKKIFRAIDLFAGIGGIRLGFTQAFGNQIDFVFSNEIDRYAIETYKANFHSDPSGDITKLNVKDIPDFDILLAGFPCQAFSIAGFRKGFQDARGTLFFYIAEILREKKPIAFLLENVKNLVNHDNGRTFQVIKDILTIDLGYFIQYKLLNAKNFGVPQNRDRIFIVGFKKNLKFEFPKPLNISVKLDDILEKQVENNYYLSQQYLRGLKKHRARHEAKGNGFGYEIRPRNGIANAIVCGGMGKERNLVNDNILPDCWKEEGDDIQLRNNEGIRKMTEREWARLQGFPDSFVFPTSKTRTYRLLANSVAVPVIKAIATKIKECLMDNIVINKNDLTTKERICINFLNLMDHKKQFTKTGKKSKITLNKFIKNSALRIKSLDDILDPLLRKGIIKRTDSKSVYFSEWVNSHLKSQNFQQILYKRFTNKKTSNFIDQYMNSKKISC